MTDASRQEELFLELVLALQQSAWMALGKIANPATGKAEIQLEAAAHAVDMLAMIQEKTRQSCSSQERQLIDNALTQLRLNYVEAARTATGPKDGQAEAQKPPAPKEEEPPAEAQAG